MTSLQCVEAFSPVQPGEEQNHEEYGLQSGQYLHNWGGVVTVPICRTTKADLIAIRSMSNNIYPQATKVPNIHVSSLLYILGCRM